MHQLKGKTVYSSTFGQNRVEKYHSNLKIKEKTKTGMVVFEGSNPLYLTPEEYKGLVEKGYYLCNTHMYLLLLDGKVLYKKYKY